MHPAWIAGAVAIALWVVIRRRRHRKPLLAVGVLAAAGALLIGLGVIELPNVEHLIEDAGQALGKWTYLAVGILAFLETGAFIGLVAPGETTVIVGGLVAGQGVISLYVLIAIVWTCAVLGDVTSYTLGRRLGREFMVKHGARVKITEERLEQVEAFFERRGGATILIGRFIGLVRAIAPFIAGASRMPLRKFLPYDILGAGLWATTFCVLGYVFWRSFDQLTAWVSRGLFAFGLFVAVVVAIVFLVRLQRNEELQAKTKAWISEQLEKPLSAPGRAVPPLGVDDDRPPGRARLRGAGPVRLEPLHAWRPRARGDDAAGDRGGRLVRVLPARRRALRARPARGRPGRRRHRRPDLDGLAGRRREGGDRARLVRRWWRSSWRPPRCGRSSGGATSTRGCWWPRS